MGLINKKRAEVNIVATMIIFAIMISALGVLYSQIAPTILGYNAETRSANQEFIFLNIANSVDGLIPSSQGSQNRVHILSNNGFFNMQNGSLIDIKVNDSNGNILAELANSIGLFTATINGTFQAKSGYTYFNRIFNENSYLMNETTDINNYYVGKVKYTYNQALYSLYFKSRLNIVETSPNNYVLTITVIKMTFITSNGVALDFPIISNEWTLRLRRLASIISTTTVAGIQGPILVGHSINGDSSKTPVYSLGSNSAGINLTIKFIVVPILFTV